LDFFVRLANQALVRIAIQAMGKPLLARQDFQTNRPGITACRRIIASEWLAGLAVLFVGSTLLLGCIERNVDRALTVPKIDRVILISIDTLRPDFLGIYNSEATNSPNLTQFATESSVFSNVLAQGASTAISHKSIFYSLYPAIHKTTINSVPHESLIAPLEVMQASGFLTAGFVGGGQLSTKYGFTKGFDEYTIIPRYKPREDGEDDLQLLRRLSFEWLDQHSSKRFFLFLHTYEVHCPYEPPAPYLNEIVSSYDGSIDPRGKCGDKFYNQVEMTPNDYQFIQQLYAAEIRYVDRFLGDLFTKLKQLGLYDSTLVVFLSDHGESFGERDRVGHNQLYNVQLQVPLVLRVPGLSPNRIAEPIELVDVMPTIFSLLDIEPPYDFQGIDLLPPLLGHRKLPQTRARFSQQLRQAAVDEAGWKAIFNIRNPSEDQLYFLPDDPEERENLATAQPERFAELKRKFTNKMNAEAELAKSFRLGENADPTQDRETREQLEALGYIP
jgi:arylsulfatase A-like enzyme